jgi:hypothetical protein
MVDFQPPFCFQGSQETTEQYEQWCSGENGHRWTSTPTLEVFNVQKLLKMAIEIVDCPIKNGDVPNKEYEKLLAILHIPM